MEKVIKRTENKVLAPKMFRRDARSIKAYRRGVKLKANGKAKFDNPFATYTSMMRDYIYIPKHKKLKGWQKENKRRKAA